jgi:hypothetical protein
VDPSTTRPGRRYPGHGSGSRRRCPGGGAGSRRQCAGGGPGCASPGCVIVLVELMGIKGAFGVPCGDRNKFRPLTPTTPTREGRSYPGAADPSDNKGMLRATRIGVVSLAGRVRRGGCTDRQEVSPKPGSGGTPLSAAITRQVGHLLFVGTPDPGKGRGGTGRRPVSSTVTTLPSEIDCRQHTAHTRRHTPHTRRPDRRG